MIAAGQAIMAAWWTACPQRAAPARTGGGAASPGGYGAKTVPRTAGRRAQGALRAALVLLADHELAASTFAARVAASVRADPYAVVATGLGAAGGALHGGASLGVEAMLAAAAGPQDVTRAVGSLLRRGERIPGFGHFVYRAGDPRAAFLLGEIRARAPGSPRLAVADALAREVRRPWPAHAEHRLRAGGPGQRGWHGARGG